MDKCECCGKPTPLDLLDAKPAAVAGIKSNWNMLAPHFESGTDFDVLECRGCYGPAWEGDLWAYIRLRVKQWFGSGNSAEGDA